MWLNDILLRGMILAQEATATPDGASPIKYDIIEPPAGLSTAQIVMLAIYALVCVGLIGCVTAQTSKSEGLMQQMMGGAAPTYKGKKSTDDNLAYVTNWMAFFFIGLSILMTLVFK